MTASTGPAFCGVAAQALERVVLEKPSARLPDMDKPFQSYGDTPMPNLRSAPGHCGTNSKARAGRLACRTRPAMGD